MSVILIGKENPDNHNIRLQLAENGCKVHHEALASAALTFLQNSVTPSIILIDWDTFKDKTAELIQQIRSLNLVFMPYVISLITRIQEGDLFIGIDAGANTCFSKTPNVDELLLKIEIGRRTLAHTLPMNQILDRVDAFVYVIDFETYELLYINEMAQDLSHASVGQTCWKTLHRGQTAPCSFCTNHLLLDETGQPNEPYVWEYQHDLDGQWYECHDQAIRWNDGRLVRLQIAHNISERKRQERLIEAHLKLSQLAHDASVKKVMQAFLDEAEQLTASHIGFFHLVEKDQVHLNLQAWSTNTLAKMCHISDANKHYPIDQAGVWVDCIREKRPVVHNDYASLPHRKGLPEGHAPVTKEVVVPIFRHNQIVAVFGVGNKDIDYDDQDLSTLTTLADMAWDIIATIQVEEKLRKTEILLIEALKSTSDGVWSWDIPTGVLTLDSNTLKMFGLESGSDTLPASEIIATIHESDRTQVETALNDLVEGLSDRYDQEFRIQKLDGQITWVRGRGKITDWDSQGRPLQLIGTNIDVTEKKQDELELKESEERFKALHDASFGGVIIHDQGLILDCNQGLSEITGFSREELVGMDGLKLIAPDSLTMVLQNINSGFDKAYEVEGIRKGGSIYPLAIRGKNVHYKGREVRVIEFRDITAGKQVEEQRRELEVQLRQKHKMEAVGYMAGGMAHNFNNNLSIILGNVELAQMKQARNSGVVPLLENAKIAVGRSRDLVKKIITYSRQGSQQKAPMHLTTITDETISLLKSTLPTTVTLQKTYSPDCDTVLINADASQIQEVLINLCNNAVQAMQENGQLNIQLEPTELTQPEIPAQYDCLPGRYAKLRVQDSGCGIPTEMLDKIFDPFFSTKEAHEGAGMGLATVQGIVARHGGFIRVNSLPDQGTTFDLYFPIAEQTHIAEPEAEDKTLPGGTERILFVDDDEMLANLGNQLLSGIGYQVSMLTDSTEALKILTANTEHFDLVITDQTMPLLSGKDLIAELKKVRPDIPTILCTGYSSQINEEDAKELGISAFMMKPLDLPTLAQTIRRVLDGVEAE